MIRESSIRLLPLLTILLLAFSACGGGERVWNPDNGLLIDPQEGYSMQFPAWGKWEMADSTGKENILFCGVNKTIGVAVMLCKFSDNILPTDLTPDRVAGHVNEFVEQQGDSTMMYTSPVIKASRYIGDSSFSFREDLLVVIPQTTDTVGIAYTGFVFNKNKREYGIVVTLPAEIADKHGREVLDDIYSGLNMN